MPDRHARHAVWWRTQVPAFEWVLEGLLQWCIGWTATLAVSASLR
jgi:hypothetical protein